MKFIANDTELHVPLTVEQVATHLRIAETDFQEQLYITALLRASTEAVENILRRPINAATYNGYADSFPSGPIELLSPLISVESINYTDSDGVVQELTDVDFYTDTVSGLVHPLYGESWPLTLAVPNAVKVSFTAGWEEVPFSITAAILLLVADLYENREAQIVGTIVAQNSAVDRLLFPYRVWS